MYGAGKLMSKAYKALKANMEDHPHFDLNKKTMGLVQAFISAVPSNYEWAINLLGFKGELSTGLAYLKDVSKLPVNGDYGLYSVEGGFLHAFTIGRVGGDHMKAWKTVEPLTRDFRTNLLSAYFRANLASRARQNDEVIHTLANRSKDPKYYPFPFMDFSLGLAYLNKLSPEAAAPLERFMRTTKGIHFKKSCLQLLAWHHYIHGNSKSYRSYRQRIEDEGTDSYEEDKLALLFTEKPDPHPALLKARLLFDGGYDQDALAQIRDLKSKDFNTIDQKAEYAYRKGRIYQSLGETEYARLFFIAASKFGSNSTEYYGAYSCIQLGEIYLDRGEVDEAKSYFKKAKTYKKNKEYTDSIEQKVINGIKRCNS